MSTEKMTSASIEEIISRMIEAAGAKNQQEMIEKTGLSDGIASKWRKRGNVPDSGIYKVAQMTGVRFEWLKTGEGDMRSPPPTISEGQGEYSTQPLTKDELYLVRTYRKLHPAEKDKVIEIAELYCGVKEPWRSAGGGSSSKESNSK